MGADLSTSVREAIMLALRADVPLLALVPVERVYARFSPPDTPYPFTRFGVSIAAPWNASCIAGSAHEVTIHAFDDGPSEEGADAIAAAIVKALDGATLVTVAADVTIRWTGGQTVEDPVEPQIWHAYRTFNVDAAE